MKTATAVQSSKNSLLQKWTLPTLMSFQALVAYFKRRRFVEGSRCSFTCSESTMKGRFSANNDVNVNLFLTQIISHMDSFYHAFLVLDSHWFREKNSMNILLNFSLCVLQCIFFSLVGNKTKAIIVCFTRKYYFNLHTSKFSVNLMCYLLILYN